MYDPAREVVTCRNCDHALEGDYCPQCGQAYAAGERLTMRGLIKDVLKKVFGVEEGMWKLTKGLFTRPAWVCDQFVKGARKPFGNPLNFLFMAVLFSSAANYYALGGGVKVMPIPLMGDAPYQDAFFQFLSRYFSIILFLGIPVTAFFGWRLFHTRAADGRDFNYAEHLLTAGLLRGASLLMFCFFAPLLRWFSDLWYVWIGQYALLWVIYFALTYVRLFGARDTKGVLKAFAVPLLTIVVMNGVLMTAFWLLYRT